MTSFLEEVTGKNGNGLSVGILVSVNFTDMRHSPTVNLGSDPHRGKAKIKEVLENNPAGTKRELVHHRH